MLIGTLRRDERQNPPPGVKLFEGWGPEDEKVKVHRETWAYIAKNLASYQCCAERPGRSPLPVEPDYVERDREPVDAYDVEMGTADEELGFGIFTDREDPSYQSLVQMMQHMLRSSWTKMSFMMNRQLCQSSKVVKSCLVRIFFGQSLLVVSKKATVVDREN